MKNLFVTIIFFLNITQSFAFPTEASRFAEKQYERAHIVVKKEHSYDYGQTAGERFIPKIVYGYGDLKIKGCKKVRITYIVLTDKCQRPFWSCIYPSY